MTYDPLRDWIGEVHQILATKTGNALLQASSGSATTDFYTIGAGSWQAFQKQPPYVEWLPGDITYKVADARRLDRDEQASAEVQQVTCRIVDDDAGRCRQIKNAIIMCQRYTSASSDNIRHVTRATIGNCRDATSKEFDIQASQFQVYEQDFTLEMPITSINSLLIAEITQSIPTTGSITSTTLSGSV